MSLVQIRAALGTFYAVRKLDDARSPLGAEL